MWIVLNPKKGTRFTTKGINLHKAAPTAFVDPGLEKEFMNHIDAAVAAGTVIRIDEQSKGMAVPKQAKISDVDDEDTDAVIKYKSGWLNGELVTIIGMPDKDGNFKEAEKKESGAIITGITESPRDEEED